MKWLTPLLILSTLVFSSCGPEETNTTRPVSFVHYFTGSLSGGIEDLASQLQKGSSGPRLAVTPLDHETFKSLIRLQLEGPNPPDLFSYWAGARTEYLVKQNHLAPLTKLKTQGITENFSPSVIKACTYHGQLYMLPLTQHFVGFFYNKEIFQSLQLQEPRSWEDFQGIIEQLNSKGKIPIALGAKNRWPAQFWFDYLLLGLKGYQFREDLLGGKISMTDPGINEVFEEWQKLIEGDAFNEGINELTWDKAADLVVKGKAGMTLMGTWTMAHFEEKNWHPQEDYGFFPFPRMTQEGEVSALGPVDGILMSRNSPLPQQALEALRLFADPIAQKSFNKGSGALVPLKEVDPSFYNPIQREILEHLEEVNHWAFNFDLAAPPTEAEIGLNRLMSFLEAPQKRVEILQKWQDDLENNRN